MKDRRRDSARTRQGLLNAASRVFAAKGFKSATIAEICNEAGANVASVNYHFGGKQNLYMESWRHAFRKSLRSYPADGGVREDARPEERLRGRITSLLHRIADEDSRDFAIIYKEFANPTGLLKEILKKEINPQRKALDVLVRDLLGAEATEKQVRFCHASIVGQCFHLLRIRQMLLNGQAGKDMLDVTDIDAFAEHVVAFSLAGMEMMRRDVARCNGGKRRAKGGR